MLVQAKIFPEGKTFVQSAQSGFKEVYVSGRRKEDSRMYRSALSLSAAYSTDDCLGTIMNCRVYGEEEGHMLLKIIYFTLAAAAGALFSYIGIPAGWLIGALFTGVAYSLFFGELKFYPGLFQFALAFIGVNIGLMMKVEMFSAIRAFFIPLLISLVMILAGSWLFGKILQRFSSVDEKTAFFCCIPGGASVMMALSEEYGADQRIVAAFHSTRIILFVLMVPLLAGLLAGDPGAQGAAVSPPAAASAGIHPFDLLLFAGIVLAALGLSKVLRIPAAPFLYAMLLGFLFNQYVFEIGTMPQAVIGIGQVLLGGMIGLRFDRSVFRKLKEIGVTSIIVMLLYLGMSFLVSTIFFWLTPLDYVTSLLSIVPAGAAEMASTAALLDLKASIVASLQLVRLLIIFLLLPLIIPLLVKKPQKGVQ